MPEEPLFIKNAKKALKNKECQNILNYLAEFGSKSFNNIYKDLTIIKDNLRYHIETLMRYGLIYNFYTKNKFSEKYSHYEISKLGKLII